MEQILDQLNTYKNKVKVLVSPSATVYIVTEIVDNMPTAYFEVEYNNGMIVIACDLKDVLAGC